MTAEKSTRRVYSAEQLQRLRASCSAPKLNEAIEEHDGDDAELVKEHVLRGTKSFHAPSYRTRARFNFGRVPSSSKSNNENVPSAAAELVDQLPPVIVDSSAPSLQPVLGEIPNNGQILRPGTYRLRPSPTPSIRRKKVEAIVKQHASPQHVRVTAGGRIVPSEQSPLCQPRYGYSAVKVNGGLIKFAPSHPAGKASSGQWMPVTQNGFVAEDINGNLFQIVDGTILPLNEVNGALQLHMPAPNLNITSRGTSLGASNPHFGPLGNRPINHGERATSHGRPMTPPDPSIAVKANALKAKYSELQAEEKQLNQAEAIHGSKMMPAAKQALWNHRRQLVLKQDEIRRDLKMLEQESQRNVPTSPKAMPQMQSTSPRNRLPAFLQRYRPNNGFNYSVTHPAQAIGPPFGMTRLPDFGPPYGSYGQVPPSEASYPPQQPWAAPPPAMFTQPPPFDGSMGAPFPIYEDPVQTAPPAPYLAPAIPATQEQTAQRPLPQTDGARSVSDLKISPPRQGSHALPIKDPETKQVTNTKFLLNPTSPEYKPGSSFATQSKHANKPTTKSVNDRAPTPLDMLHDSIADAIKSSSTKQESISPAKQTSQHDGSSISSIRTADFFPRNTREYSTRKHDYPITGTDSEDKENLDPQQAAHALDESPITPKRQVHNTNWNPEIPDAAFRFSSPQTESYGAPTVPPGTPADANQRGVDAQLLQKPDELKRAHPSHGFDTDPVPDRETHNLSPKGKRQDFLFVEEHPERYGKESSSSPQKFHECQDEICVMASPYDRIDLHHKSHAWLQGYHAGLQRLPIGRQTGDFVVGYCEGVQESQPDKTVLSTGSPSKPISRRPSPVPRSSSRGQPNVTTPAIKRPPIETTFQSMDTLKQAVFAPQNENAILTPAPDGPRVTETSLNLGAWQKKHAQYQMPGSLDGAHRDLGQGYPFPDRTSSVVNRHTDRSSDKSSEERNIGVMCRGDDVSAGSDKPLLSGCNAQQEVEKPPTVPPKSPVLSAKTTLSGADVTNSTRIGSITSIDSAMYRQAPAYRVLSPYEWKSTSSVAHAAGLATGFFAQAQFDGPASITQGNAPSRVISGNLSPHQSRFSEGSIDGMSELILNSPPMSPTMSTTKSPRASPKRTKTESPRKDSPGKDSPARNRFEQIASKVGIKATADKTPADSPAGTPPSKRRWRDV